MAILPGSTLGMLGGGQLGRMFVTAARTMGYEVIVLDPDPNSPAGGSPASTLPKTTMTPMRWITCPAIAPW